MTQGYIWIHMVLRQNHGEANAKEHGAFHGSWFM